MTSVRSLVIFLCALFALVGSLVAAVGTAHERSFVLRGYADATITAELPFRVPRLGVNAALTQYSPEALAQHFAQMQEAGITWLRQEAQWDVIHPQEDQFNWTAWDQIISVIADYPQLQLVAALVNSPAWARDPQKRDAPYATAPPRDPALFAQFASAFAERYGHVIDTYQIWDEPNLTIGWGGSHPQPVEYVALLQAGYTAIHAVDPGAIVLAAGLAPTVETGPLNLSDDLFLRQMYLHGAAPFLDAVAGKAYGFDHSPEDRRVSRTVLNFSRIIALREIMIAFDDAQKAVWATQWGWNSLPPDWEATPSPWGNVSQTNQIAYTLQALHRADREWPWMGGMILSHWQPDAAPDHPSWGFSLLTPEGTPSALYTALTEMPVASAASNGLYPPQNRFTQYSGIWTFGPLGADLGWVNDSRFIFRFTGTSVALLLRQDNYVAQFYATINDQPANALPQDPDGNAFALLTSGSLLPEVSLVPIAHSLHERSHTLEVVADELVPAEITHRWPLVGIAVSSGNLHTPYNQQIAIAGASALISFCAVVISARQLPWRRLLRPITVILERLTTAVEFILGAVTSLALLIGMLLTFGESTPAVFRRDSVQLVLSILTGGLLFLEPGFLLMFLSGVALFILIHNRLEIGLLLVIVWSPFFLFPVELYRFAFPMAEIILLITFAAWVLHQMMHVAQSRPTTPPTRIPLTARIRQLHPLDFCVLAWVGIGVLSLVWTAQRDLAITELRTLILQPSLLYLMLRTTKHEAWLRTRLIDALLVAGFAVAFIGIFQFIRGEAIITAEANARRLAGVYGSPNNVGLLLGRCVPFAVAYLLVPVDTRRRWAAGAALLVMGIALALTQSAGALFIGVPVAVAVVIVLRFQRRAILPLIVMAALLVTGIAIALEYPRFSRLLDLTEGTNFYRIRVWQSALNIIQDYPITGIGLDQFLYQFRGQYIMPDAWDEPTLSHPHNFLLDYWVRLGIAGVFLFLATQALFWRWIWRAYRQQSLRDPLPTALIIGTMGSMANLLSHGLVDNSVYVLDLANIFVLLLVMSIPEKNISAIDETR